MGTIAVVDYGAGNLLSVTKALDFLGFACQITADAAEIARADAVILPGVGAFPDAMDNLTGRGLDRAVRESAQTRPLLGICLGMQMLFDVSSEVRPCRGLGLIPGRVDRIQTACKLPQIGWNSLEIRRENALLRGVPNGAYVYFVHSFMGFCDEPDDATALCEYGAPVTAMVARGNVYGCQFHPEKSGEVGLTILRNFGELNR